MPFSTARACMASRISRLMGWLLLDEVGSVDVAVGDLHDPGVGGQGDVRVARADELAREAAMPLDGVAGADPRATTEEAAVVIGLGQRTLDAGRGDLQRVALADLRQRERDALAEVERHAVRMVDEETNDRSVEDLREQHLDPGLALGELRLDLGLNAAHLSSSRAIKKAGERPLSVRQTGR